MGSEVGRRRGDKVTAWWVGLRGYLYAWFVDVLVCTQLTNLRQGKEEG